MARLQHMSHEHPLVFNEDTSSPNDTTYDCAVCAEKVLGSSYSCGECRFYLHKKCAEAPSEIHHPAHRDHPLLLLPASGHRNCRICRFKVKGFMYQCSSCVFFCLDFNCALLPRDTAGNLIETLHVAHPHPLISINPVESFKCKGCRDTLTDASYACFDCKVFFHKKCLELPTEIDHPCHRKHQLSLVSFASNQNLPSCNLCQSFCGEFFYQCVPCNVNIHVACAWPPPIIEDKSHHPHPFTLFLKSKNPFICDACGDQGNHVSYTCSACNIQVHRDCISLPRHIRLTLHPHPISHNFFLRVDRNDSRAWDCRICYKKVNIEHGSYSCSRPRCDFVIHVQCSIREKYLYNVVEVENPDELEETDQLYEPKSCIIRVIKEIKVGDDIIARKIEHVSHEHNLIFSVEIEDDKYCNGCVLPIISSFYYCSDCDFFLHKACAELSRMRRLWFDSKPSSLLTNGIFKCVLCLYQCSGFSYKLDDGDDQRCCLRCASIPHAFTYQANEPHYLFFDPEKIGKCDACGKDLSDEFPFRCKDCSFALHYRCVTLPRTARHKCDEHSLTLAYQDPNDYPLHHYCDICEKERDPQLWFYRCETCDNAMHRKCVIGRYQFIKAGSKYTYEDHLHPLTFVKKIYSYPECVLCGKPCQDLALEFVEHGCKYIVHWTCIKPSDDSDTDSS
ncbi:hypothetical protein GQ457_02G040390 [Hibiscus cannabinus]